MNSIGLIAFFFATFVELSVFGIEQMDGLYSEGKADY